MAGLPSSVPISLSQIISSFGSTQGGNNANPPKNLRSYLAGGGYTPSDAITHGVPSSGNLNLQSFLGTASEFTMTVGHAGGTGGNYRWRGYNSWSSLAGGNQFGSLTTSPTYSIWNGSIYVSATIAAFFDDWGNAGTTWASTTLALNAGSNLSGLNLTTLFEYNDVNLYYATVGTGSGSPTVTYSVPFTYWVWATPSNGPFISTTYSPQKGWLE